jgi:hypothetical protein
VFGVSVLLPESRGMDAAAAGQTEQYYIETEAEEMRTRRSRRRRVERFVVSNGWWNWKLAVVVVRLSYRVYTHTEEEPSSSLLRTNLHYLLLNTIHPCLHEKAEMKKGFLPSILHPTRVFKHRRRMPCKII